MSTATQVAPEKLNKTYYFEFLKYVKKYDVKINNEALMLWDETYNNSELKTYLEDKFGAEYIYSVGLKELFSRYLYGMQFLKLSASKDNPPGLKKGLKSMTVIQRGVLVPEATKDQLAYLVGVHEEKLKAAAQKLALCQLTPRQIHKLVDEALNEG